MACEERKLTSGPPSLGFATGLDPGAPEASDVGADVGALTTSPPVFFGSARFSAYTGAAKLAAKSIPSPRTCHTTDGLKSVQIASPNLRP